MALVVSLPCLRAYILPGEHKNREQLQVGCYVLTYSLTRFPLSCCFLDDLYWVLTVGWLQLFSTATTCPVTNFLLSAITRFLLDTLLGFNPSASCSKSRSSFSTRFSCIADEETPKQLPHMVVHTCVCAVLFLNILCFVSHQDFVAQAVLNCVYSNMFWKQNKRSD